MAVARSATNVSIPSGDRGVNRARSGLRTSARSLESDEDTPRRSRCTGIWLRLRRLRRQLWRGLRSEVRGCCGKTMAGRALYFVATNHPDQVRENLWQSMQKIREEWWSRDGGGEYARRHRKRRQGVHLAGKRSGAEGPGFGIHCFIINNPGTIDDFYHVQEEVNAGGSAQVFKAMEKATKALRAIKRIVKGAGDIGRVIQEVAIMKTLDHPNIIKLFETFEDDRHLFLVLEFCKGGDVLDRVVADGVMDELSSAMVMRGMLSALNYLNANGYAHRDLKPENIMYKESKEDRMVSQLRLVDFGYACRSPEEGKSLRTKVAPEVLAGSYGKECDMWSLGALCFMIISGIPPFFGDTDAQTLRLIKEGKFIFQTSQWAEVSKGCMHFIRRCLEVDFTKRLTVTEALEHPWLKHKFRGKAMHLRDETVERLLSFAQYHNLRRASMLAVAFHMEAEDTKLLLELFRGLDLNGDGLLTTDEFSTGVRSMGVDPELLRKMVHCLDADHSGVIDYTEFLAATLEAYMFIDNHGVMLRAFRSFDQDDSGGLTAEEVAETIDMVSPDQFMEMQRIFEEVDVNGDGVMDYAEFYRMLKADLKVTKPETKEVDEDESYESESASEDLSPKAVKFGDEGDDLDEEEEEEEEEAEEEAGEGHSERSGSASEAAASQDSP
ncbi:unnamed protein product [Effrenium voratum]|uniref:non-specific serine/threonine protein kinase n=1 Tax=Effrenium voratum TaxID=2562239 RepID=A0AA36MR92_9DINO|nr:unnamed protein product [Effrenium voratum]